MENPKASSLARMFLLIPAARSCLLQAKARGITLLEPFAALVELLV